MECLWLCGKEYNSKLRKPSIQERTSDTSFRALQSSCFTTKPIWHKKSKRQVTKETAQEQGPPWQMINLAKKQDHSNQTTKGRTRWVPAGMIVYSSASQPFFNHGTLSWNRLLDGEFLPSANFYPIGQLQTFPILGSFFEYLRYSHIQHNYILACLFPPSQETI